MMKIISSFILLFTIIVDAKSICIDRETKLIERKILNDIIVQTKSRGVNLWAFSLKPTDIPSFADELPKASSLCTYNVHKQCDLAKLGKKEFIFTSSGLSITKYPSNVITHASGNVILTFLTVMLRVDNLLHYLTLIFRSILYRTALSESTPKVMLILIVKRQHRRVKDYRRVYGFFTQRRVFDVEIMEIRVPKSRRPLRKCEKMHYRVHWYNPFSKIYKILKYTKESSYNWFQNKQQNLMGFAVNASSIKSQVKYSRAEGRQYFVEGTDSFFIVCMREFLNCTINPVPQWLENKRKNADLESLMDIELPQHKYNYPYTYETYMRTQSQETVSMFTPVIQRVIIEYNFWTIPFHIAVFVLVVIACNICSRYFHCDPIMWNHCAIVGMILGIGNSRRPIGFTEKLFYMSVVLSGVFFANDMIFGAVNFAVPRTKEKWFFTFNDLKKCGLTAYVMTNPKVDKSNGVFQPNVALLTSNVSYVTFARSAIVREQGILSMIKFRNASVASARSRLMTILNSGKVYLRNQVVAKESSVIEVSYMKSYRLKRYSQLYERFSDLYWKFREAGFDSERELDIGVSPYIISPYIMFMTEYAKFYPEDFHESDEETSDCNLNSCTLILVLFVGLGLSLIFLIYEMHF